MPLSNDTFNNAGGAVSDLFKAQGDKAEGQNYELAADYARQNVDFTKQSTAIKEMQLDRSIYKSLGETQAAVGGSGLAASGSALDILRDSASQGSLTKSVLAEQGAITEAGYDEQAHSYDTMANAAKMAAEGDTIGGIIKGVTAVASIGLAPFTGGASLAIGGALLGAEGGIGHA